ncbi:MAG: flagellar biosynthetic protein FliR [Bryobacterales bacterium]|nr:flagellar biosynthetic protein FliR [Bryobacteraceae bacterium]MDW8355258.1 flagellar biosynthetic protein FliR [Bryobacterales bacterium]
MPGEIRLPLATVWAFALVLARMAGVLALAPLPGLRNGLEPARIVLAVALTVALYPRWPAVGSTPTFGTLAAWVAAEVVFGLAVGLAVMFVIEVFQMAVQAVGLQAGFAYASMIDPQTQADSGVLLVLGQLTAGLLFFALGLEREVIRILASSLEAWPPGTWRLTSANAEALVETGAGMFSVGLRLAFPTVALLLLGDIVMALLGRIHQQVQLLTLSFPVKLLGALAVLAATASVFPQVMTGYARHVLGALRQVAAGG